MDAKADASSAISAIFNRSQAALIVAKQVFKLINTNQESDIAMILTDLCRVATSGVSQGTAISKGAEPRMGALLAHNICQYKHTNNKESLLGMKAKYKPVELRKRPVPVSVPSMKRQPYKMIPTPKLPSFPTHPTKKEHFIYTKRLTKERMDKIMSNIVPGFLSEDEIGLLLWVLAQNEEAIAFEDNECGRFKAEYFPDYVMETVPHEPWQLPPIRIAESIKEEVNRLLQNQIDSGKLEPSMSSYRSRMFTVKKPKGGLRVVWDLQQLNKYSVQDAMLPPNVNEFAESFVGYSIYGTLDLYSGYHHRTLHPQSRPLTACQTMKGNVQLTTLPMGYTNSMQEFQRSTSHILESLSPDRALAFVDDCGVKGPKTRYGDEPIPENPNIRKFVWEYAHTLFTTFALFIEAGATASGTKLVLATRQVDIVGYVCDLSGMRPHHGVVTKVINWPRPRNVTEVRGFLGTVGVARSWIKNFAKIAKPLTELTKVRQSEFEWNQEAEQAVAILKQKVQEVVALKKLDIEKAKQASLTREASKDNEGRVILAVDSSIIAIGYVLYQVFRADDEELLLKNGKGTARNQTSRLKRYPIRFGSITLNEVESRYSQPKVELYGLFRALKALEYLLWGINVLVEVDASFLKATANSPGLPNAAATRWVAYIQLFDIEFKHIPAESHKAPDGLSRRQHADEDTEDSLVEEEDARDNGSFIRARKPVPAPGLVPIEPTNRDINYVGSTRLVARKGEPINSIRRRCGEKMEVLHLALIEQDIEIANRKCNFSIMNVPKARTENEILGMTTQGEERDNGKPQPLHAHHILDEDRDEYWKNIITYLETLAVPKTVKNRKSFIQTTRKYFIFENALWRRTNDLPRKVILSPKGREELIRNAHDESGHRGRDPTYKKLADFYFWPNMLTQIALYCRTCRQCQLRSSYHPKVMINPTWVPTILRKFNLDLVEMGIKSSKYLYIVDVRDDLTGWLEARMLSRKSSEDVAEFLWQDIICRFGCIPQISTDNGTEFKKAVDILARKYGIKIIRISPYNPAGNGMIERGHRTWINSIWKLCGSAKEKWSKWFYPALWADRITTRKATGYSPYYLLYGKPHLFPYSIREETWYTIDWHGIRSTRDLLAVRALQIGKLRLDRRTASKRNITNRINAAKDYAVRNAGRLVAGNYKPRELVLIAMKGPGVVRGNNAAKSEDTWAGPFRITKKHRSGSYQLEELDGAILKGSVAARHLKPFYTRDDHTNRYNRQPGTGTSDSENQFDGSTSEEEEPRDQDYQPSDA